MNKHLKLAIEKFNNKDFFECHDILEDYWFECKDAEKDFYQGILHYAVAFHHLIDKKNPSGAKLQFKKCIERLKEYTKPTKGIDVIKIIHHSKKNIDYIDSNKPGEVKHLKIKVM